VHHYILYIIVHEGDYLSNLEPFVALLLRMLYCYENFVLQIYSISNSFFINVFFYVYATKRNLKGYKLRVKNSILLKYHLLAHI